MVPTHYDTQPLKPWSHLAPKAMVPTHYDTQPQSNGPNTLWHPAPEAMVPTLYDTPSP